MDFYDNGNKDVAPKARTILASLMYYRSYRMLAGKIKWFNNASGIGFLTTSDHKGDVFVHYSIIEMEGYKTVAANQEVKCTVGDGPKGLFAERVELV